MRLVFLGSGAFGVPTLDVLAKKHDVLQVVTQPDRPAGRRRTLTATPVGQFAADHNLPVIKPESVNQPEIISAIHHLAPTAIVVIAYGQKLSEALLDGQFAINLHSSLLPKYRGAAPINWAVINGETQTGVSVITVTQRMDAGDILGQRSTPIDPMETAGELHDRLALLGPQVVLEVLEQYEGAALQPIAQDESQATKAPKLSKSDGTVDFAQPARLVQARVHGLTPWPGCTIRITAQPNRESGIGNGCVEASAPQPPGADSQDPTSTRLKLLRVEVQSTTDVDAEPGTVLDDGAIACQPGAVRLRSVQPPGGKIMTFEAYRRGHRFPEDARCEPI